MSNKEFETIKTQTGMLEQGLRDANPQKFFEDDKRKEELTKICVAIYNLSKDKAKGPALTFLKNTTGFTSVDAKKKTECDSNSAIGKSPRDMGYYNDLLQLINEFLRDSIERHGKNISVSQCLNKNDVLEINKVRNYLQSIVNSLKNESVADKSKKNNDDSVLEQTSDEYETIAAVGTDDGTDKNSEKLDFSDIKGFDNFLKKYKKDNIKNEDDWKTLAKFIKEFLSTISDKSSLAVITSKKECYEAISEENNKCESWLKKSVLTESQVAKLAVMEHVGESIERLINPASIYSEDSDVKKSKEAILTALKKFKYSDAIKEIAKNNQLSQITVSNGSNAGKAYAKNNQIVGETINVLFDMWKDCKYIEIKFKSNHKPNDDKKYTVIKNEFSDAKDSDSKKIQIEKNKELKITKDENGGVAWKKGILRNSITSISKEQFLKLFENLSKRLTKDELK